MFNNLTYKLKFWMLTGLVMVFIMVAYQLAIKKTVRLFRNNIDIYQKLENIEDAPIRIQLLERKHHELDELIGKSINLDSTWRKLLKEISVAFIIASLFSTLIFVFNYFMSDTMELTVMVSVSLFTVMMFASVFGAFMPMILNRFNIDPAVATGPFITTVNDVLGIIVYFMIGQIVSGFFAA